ncbi:MAG: diguanylate cyclase [Deltaproteobacteria bacterium]|nr:diguanylate cyclase [Deltaproteobacteria bacterium]
MTIRQGILLLGAIAGLILAYVLADGALGQISDYRFKQAMAERLRLAPALSAVVHELQRERGLASGYLGNPTRTNLDLLLAQHVRTDQALADRRLSNVSLERLRAELLTTRRQIEDGHMSWASAFAFYVREVEEIQSHLIKPTETDPVIAPDLQALVHLMSAKEYLGQIRAMANKSLHDWGEVNMETSYGVARLDARRLVRIDLFRRSASKDLEAAFDRIMVQMDARKSLELVGLIASPFFHMADIDTDEWFPLTSRPIDAIRQVEDYVLAYMTRELDARMRAIRAKALFETVAALIVVGTVLSLVVLTTRRLLRILDTLAENIDRITGSHDFSTRIPSHARGEIGTIVRGFNTLLDTAETLLKEKQRQAYTDALTGVPNRLYFTEVAHNQIARRQRHSGPMSLIMFDIDHFKRINDTHGHDVGDDVLRKLTSRIQASVRSIDVFARWGGEEFIILLPDDPPEAAMVLAEKLRSLVEDTDFGPADRVTVSFGVAGLHPDDDFDGLCKRADLALYESKNSGRNRVTLAR